MIGSLHIIQLNRVQTTRIGSFISEKATTLCAVPQGSVLGPLLFLIYVNDIYMSSDKLNFYLFADDTNLLYADKSLKSLESVVNSELIKVYNWLTANKLTLNVKKSNYARLQIKLSAFPPTCTSKVIHVFSTLHSPVGYEVPLPPKFRVLVF